MEQKTGTIATIAIISALVSFFLTFSGHVILALLAAVLAIPLGIFGLLMAASPKVSGGILSIIAIILGGIGVVVAVLGMIGIIIF